MKIKSFRKNVLFLCFRLALTEDIQLRQCCVVVSLTKAAVKHLTCQNASGNVSFIFLPFSHLLPNLFLSLSLLTFLSLSFFISLSLSLSLSLKHILSFHISFLSLSLSLSLFLYLSLLNTFFASISPFFLYLSLPLILSFSDTLKHILWYSLLYFSTN